MFSLKNWIIKKKNVKNPGQIFLQSGWNGLTALQKLNIALVQLNLFVINGLKTASAQLCESFRQLTH